jgi:uncharacterized protein YgiM (DUF1202 family)
MRRLTFAGISAALVLVIVAGCGGSAESPSPSEAPADTAAPLETEAPIVVEATPEPEATPAAATGTTFYAACGGVAVREGPAADEGLVVRISKGTKVRVVETVSGASYDAGTCGESGDQWLKITRIAGKSVMKQYDLQVVYAAAGFFGEGQP